MLNNIYRKSGGKRIFFKDIPDGVVPSTLGVPYIDNLNYSETYFTEVILDIEKIKKLSYYFLEVPIDSNLEYELTNTKRVVHDYDVIVSKDKSWIATIDDLINKKIKNIKTKYIYNI